jgi:peptidoglycan/LPS O-acetylase OafA/YrhL
VTLRDALRGRDNALNLVRLVLAGLVVVGHSWPIGGFGANGFMLGMRTWAVYGFFAISGYLIAGSRLRLSWAPFMMRRAARILPGYWACLFVTAFGAAPLLALARGTGFDVASAASFVRNNWGLLVTQQTIGATVKGAPVAWTINGSLWTLPHEALAYILVGLVLGFGMVRERLVLSSMLMFGVVSAHAAAVSGGLWGVTTLSVAASLGGFFTAGVLAYSIGDRVLVSWRVAAAALTLVLMFGIVAPSVELLALPLTMLLLWCGAALPVHWGAKNDYSYGVYIYAFPMQQLLFAAGMSRFGPWVFALVSFLLVGPLAALSWWFVERPVMGLSHRRRPSTERGIPASDVRADVL